MPDPRTLRELALVRRAILLELDLVQARRRIGELEQAMSWMWHADIPLIRIADGARQSWPHVNPDGSDTIGETK